MSQANRRNYYTHYDRVCGKLRLMPGKWFSLPPKVWLMVLLGSALVGLLIPRHREEPPEAAMWRRMEEAEARPAPTPGADPPGQGGIVLRSADEPPVRVKLDGVTREIRQVYYSRHDNQFEPMISHAQDLRGNFYVSEAMPLPPMPSVPHLRLTVSVKSEGDDYFHPLDISRFLVQDEQGFWHPPITYGEVGKEGKRFDIGLTYFLPLKTRPAALGWRAEGVSEALNLFYGGVAYSPDFIKSYGRIYVMPDPSGNDVSWRGGTFEPSIQFEAKAGRFYLGGVDMSEWTERHQKDRGFGNTKVLLSFPQREAARKAATSSAQ